MERGTDDFKKHGNNDFSAETFFGSAIVAFRMKTTINLLLHMTFAALYAFEYNNQVVLYTDAISGAENTTVDVVYTPAGNIVVMVLNLILCLLTAQITVNIDS